MPKSAIYDFQQPATQPGPIVRLLGRLLQPVRGVASHTNGNLLGGAVFQSITSYAGMEKAIDILRKVHAAAPAHAVQHVVRHSLELGAATTAAAAGATAAIYCIASPIGAYLNRGANGPARQIPLNSVRRFNPFAGPSRT